jgi:hypothetical protein
VAPPAEVEGASFATIFADVGWELTVTDAGTIPLPAELSGVQGPELPNVTRAAR